MCQKPLLCKCPSVLSPVGAPNKQNCAGSRYAPLDAHSWEDSCLQSRERGCLYHLSRLLQRMAKTLVSTWIKILFSRIVFTFLFCKSVKEYLSQSDSWFENNLRAVKYLLCLDWVDHIVRMVRNISDITQTDIHTSLKDNYNLGFSEFSFAKLVIHMCMLISM